MNKQQFLRGMRHAIPIGLGYLTVSFSVGITCQITGLDILQGFFISFLNNASAGEYAGLTVIKENSGFLSMVLMMLVANARYLLMGCALSQHISPDTPLRTRMLMGFEITDEVFGIAIASPGYVNKWYYYGAMTLAIPAWSIGTVIGIAIGNIMSPQLISAFSVMLFGMFIAIIIPAGKKDKVVMGCIGISFILSYVMYIMPLFSGVSEGFRTIILTIIIAGVAALLFPKEEVKQ